MKTVLIEYVLKESASTEEVERDIAAFIHGIRDLGVGIRYASHRRQNVERAYAHVGYIPNDEALKALQAAPFFDRFSAALRPRGAEGPRASWLEVVASTDG